MKILVVEDQHRVRNFICRLLRENSYVVDIARLGRDAVRKAKNTNYGCILFDIRLPNTDISQVCRNLRAAQFKVPVLIVVGHSSQNEALEKIDFGSISHLASPCAVTELLACVNALLIPGKAD